MSVDAGLSLHLSEHRIMDIMDCYRKCGLDVFDGDWRAYIVTSSDDSCDWEYLSVKYDELKSVIESRERDGLPVGIAVYENGEQITYLLKTQPGELIVSCDIIGKRSRKTTLNTPTSITV